MSTFQKKVQVSEVPLLDRLIVLSLRTLEATRSHCQLSFDDPDLEVYTLKMFKNMEKCPKRFLARKVDQ